MSFKLLQLIDNHLTRPSVYLPRQKSFYPSEASVKWRDRHGIERVSGTCLRQSWYRLKGGNFEIEKSPRAERIFVLGKAVEELLVEQTKQIGIWIANNVKFYDQERNISGEIDSLVKDPDTNELVCIEYKSFFGYKATKDICGNTKQIGTPKTSQLLQVMIYADVGQKYNLWNYVKMVYFARDSAEGNEFDVKLIQDNTGKHRASINGVIDYRFYLEDIYDRFEELRNTLDSDIPPPREFDIEWSKDKVYLMESIGEVSKTAFEAYQKNPKKNSIGDWQCFAPETLVWMENGTQKEISNVKVGDKVIGFDGPTKVIRVGSKPNNEKVLRIRSACMLDTITTKEHKWLTANWSSLNNYYQNKPFMLKMTEAANLSLISNKDYRTCLLMPVITEHKNIELLTKEHYRLLGYYTAEGCLANSQNGRYYQVKFTINQNENDLASDIIYCATKLFNCTYQDKIVEDNRCEKPRHYRVLTFYSVEFADFIRTRILGKKASLKKLTNSIMRASIEGVQEFINAVIIGDGCTTTQRKNPNCNIIATSSRILANQYQQLLWRLNIPARVCYGNPPGEMDGYSTKQGYRVDWQGEVSTIKFISIENSAFAAIPIRSITETDSIPEVWDIEVESPYHLFATESGLASNCSYCKFKDMCHEST